MHAATQRLMNRMGMGPGEAADVASSGNQPSHFCPVFAASLLSPPLPLWKPCLNP